MHHSITDATLRTYARPVFVSLNVLLPSRVVHMQAVVKRYKSDSGDIWLSTKALEPAPGAMLADSQRVFRDAEQMAAALHAKGTTAILRVKAVAEEKASATAATVLRVGESEAGVDTSGSQHAPYLGDVPPQGHRAKVRACLHPQLVHHTKIVMRDACGVGSVAAAGGRCQDGCWPCLLFLGWATLLCLRCSA